MPKSATLGARPDADPGRLATATGRSKSPVITAALRSYVATERQLLAAVELGKQAVREGRMPDHETVVATFNRLTATNP